MVHATKLSKRSFQFFKSKTVFCAVDTLEAEHKKSYNIKMSTLLRAFHNYSLVGQTGLTTLSTPLKASYNKTTKRKLCVNKTSVASRVFVFYCKNRSSFSEQCSFIGPIHNSFCHIHSELWK